MSACIIRPIQVEIFIKVEDLEEILKIVEPIKEKHPDIVVTIRVQINQSSSQGSVEKEKIMGLTGEVAKLAAQMLKEEANEALVAAEQEKNKVSIDPDSYVAKELKYQTALLHQILDELKK